MEEYNKMPEKSRCESCYYWNTQFQGNKNEQLGECRCLGAIFFSEANDVALTSKRPERGKPTSDFNSVRTTFEFGCYLHSEFISK